MQKINNMKYVQQKFIIILLRLILVSIVILVGAGIVLDIGNETHSLKNDELFMIDQRLSSLFFEINNFPRGPGQDVVFLSQLASLKNYVSMPDNNYATVIAQQVKKDFQVYLAQSRAHYSIQFIDFNSGKKIYSARAEDKSNEEIRHYFDHDEYESVSASLKEKSVYISPLHRHQERGKILTALYYLTPVFDELGQHRGAVILSIDADYFLEDIRHYFKDNEMVYLVDSKGFYLAHPDQKKEFIASREGFGSFVNDYPDIGEQVLSSDKRRLENKEYIFSLRRIYPTASGFEMYDNGQDEKSYYWILVSAYKKPIVLSGVSFLSGDFFVKHLIMFVSVLILVIVGLLGTRYLVPRNSKDDENL